jgi:hypothetical protein
MASLRPSILSPSSCSEIVRTHDGLLLCELHVLHQLVFEVAILWRVLGSTLEEGFVQERQ